MFPPSSVGIEMPEFDPQEKTRIGPSDAADSLSGDGPPREAPSGPMPNSVGRYRILRVLGKVELSWRFPEDSEYVGRRSASKRLLLVANTNVDPNSTAKPQTDKSGMELRVVEGNEFVWAGPPGAKIYFHALDLVGSMATSQWLGEIPEGDGPHEIQIPFEPAGLLTGRFLDTRGQPVTDFQVHVRGSRPDQMITKFESIHHNNGRFAIGPLPLGAGYKFQAFVTGTKRWGFGITESFEIDAANPVVDFDVQLTSSAYLSGTVVDASGTPLSEVPISLGVATAGRRQGLGPEQRTDAAGRFRVPVSVPEVDGKFTLGIRPQAYHAGRGIALSPSDAINGVDLGDIHVGPASTISGKVVDESGMPVSRVYVNLKPRVQLASDYPQGLTERTDDVTLVIERQ
jgi:protocatechuate 3,4-dioxygenase beta subunit